MIRRQVRERDLVRELALQIAEIAASDENAQVQRRWRDVNALRTPDRAPVWCRPVGAWSELLPEDSLVCCDPWYRSVERRLRQVLIKHGIGDDSPVDDQFAVSAVIDRDPPNTWGVDVGRHVPDDVGGAWAFDPPLVSGADFDRLVLPRFTYNETQTEEALSRAHNLLGDILPVRRICDPPLGATLCTYAAELRGLAHLMLDMALRPDLVHRLMAYLRDAVLRGMDFVEGSGLLTPNNVGPMTCSDPIGPEPVDAKITCANLWCMANSQELDGVSPAMWEEYYLNYQKPIFQQFGLVGYGCCENLTRKIDGVRSIPNLRIFVCSAWTCLEAVQKAVGQDYVIMWRQKASDVVFPDDIETIRRDLEQGCKQLQGHHYQIVLRELQTLSGHPDRLHEWTRSAIEMAEKYA
jgi:hypothetical protein